MKLADVLHRTNPPIPWQEGDNIPWSKPAFSQRMLAEHLSQEHDLASRRSHIIDQHVQWIHEVLLSQRAAHILDLGCGPGLYCNRLAALGHTCAGIDYSPASIAYAQDIAKQGDLATKYQLADIRTANYGGPYDLIMLLFGELNVFSRADADCILSKALAALRPGGIILLEAHVYSSLIPNPQAQNTWFSSEGGLFSPSPHLVLIEQSWDQTLSILTRRYYVIDTATADVTRYAQSMQSYGTDQYEQLLKDSGFTEITIRAGLAYDRISPPPEFCAIVAHKPA